MTTLEAVTQASEEIRIAVPKAYKDYLLPRNQFIDLRLLGVHVAALILFYSRWKWSGNKIAYDHLVMYAVAYGSAVMVSYCLWRHQAKKPWQYTVNENRFRLIEWQYKNRLWQWHALDWSREVVGDVVEGEWHGLPALYIKTAAKNPKDECTLVMVYAHEDWARVATQIMPLIEHCRWRFRHNFWCEQLRSSGK